MSPLPVLRRTGRQRRSRHEAMQYVTGVHILPDDLPLVIHAGDDGPDGSRIIHLREAAQLAIEAVIAPGGVGESADNRAAVVDAGGSRRRSAGDSEGKNSARF